ncbi:hypothetical protein [Polymorphospora sp. NPDC050346]|uniref:hypothetical protein n=1 Tax=Polymorphospora sp. NPDC050346 TaxID=3155780 RepID=UPI0033F24BF5
MPPPVGDDLWYGPDDQWPRHDHPSFRNAFRVARKAGWHFRGTLGHGFGRAYCGRVDRGGEVCKVIVNSTPKDPESRVKDLLRAVRDCPHRYAGQTSQLGLAGRLLDDADRLLDAAERMVAADLAARRAGDRLRRAEELVQLAEENADEFDRLLREAADFEAEARELTQAGWSEGAEIIGPAADVRAYLVGAEDRARHAGQMVGAAPCPTDPRIGELAARCRLTKNRISAVRLRLRCDDW